MSKEEISIRVKLEDEIKKLQSELDKDISFLDKIYQVKPIPAWMSFGGVFAALFGIGALLNLIFSVRLHIEDYIINLTVLVLGGGFGLYTLHKDRSHTQFIQSCESKLRAKKEKLDLLHRIKK